MVRNKFPAVLCGIWCFLTITACLSCRVTTNVPGPGANSVMKTKDSQATVRNGNASLSLTPTAGQQLSSIRQVNFKDFTYPWYPSFLTPPLDSREVTLRNGKFAVEEDQSKGIRFLTLELDDVSYENLTGDSSEQAFLYIQGIAVMNRFVGCLFIYDFTNGRPRLIWQYETGDRADGGLRKAEVKDQTLIIDQNVLEGGEGLCCPKKFIRRYFKWNGEEFRIVKSEVLRL